MAKINTIEDLVRILREQPAWAEAVRSLLLTDDLLDLPARFDRFVQSQEETNRRLSETLAEMKEISEDNRQRLARLEGRFGRMEDRVGNFEGLHYERIVRPKAMARSHINLGFGAFYIALSNEAGRVDPRLISAVSHATREKLVTNANASDLFETDLIISDEDNLHAVFEISLTADDYDIRRARERADVLQTITGGTVSPAVITTRIDDARYAQAEAEGVTVFVIPYP